MAAMPHRSNLGLNKLNLRTDNVNPEAVEGPTHLRKSTQHGYQETRLSNNIRSPEIKREPIQYTGQTYYE